MDTLDFRKSIFRCSFKQQNVFFFMSYNFKKNTTDIQFVSSYN